MKRLRTSVIRPEGGAGFSAASSDADAAIPGFWGATSDAEVAPGGQHMSGCFFDAVSVGRTHGGAGGNLREVDVLQSSDLLQSSGWAGLGLAFPRVEHRTPKSMSRVTRTLLLSASAATAFRLMPTPIGHVNRIASATAIAAPLIVSSRSLCVAHHFFHAFSPSGRRTDTPPSYSLRSGIRASADDLEAQIKATVSESKVVVYSKSWCPFCQKTKATLSDLGIEFNAIELDELDDGAEIQDTLLAVTGQRTVPNVFVGGQHLGGNDDTQKAAKSGKLAEMLK